MERNIIAIRPEPGLSQTRDRARAMGLDIAIYPLFQVEPVAWTLTDDTAFDGLLIGSANAIRHGGTQLALLLDIPVYAVGENTANVAREAGFTVAHIGEGGLQSVLDSLQHKELRFLRLAGEDHVDLNLPRSHTIVSNVVYKSVAKPAPQELTKSLSGGAIVMLHSAIAATHFVNECNRMGLDKHNVALACLGPRIAEAVGMGWADIAIAPEANDAALLALVKNMCR